MADIAVTYRNTGERFWDLGKDIFKGVSSGITNIKDDANAFHDTAQFAEGFIELFKCTGFGTLALPAKVGLAIKNGISLVDGTQIFCDMNWFFSGEWRKATFFAIFQQMAMVSAEAIGTFTWLGELGFYNLATMADKLGSVASVFGKAFAVVTGSAFVVGIAGVGFFWMGLDSTVKAVYSSNSTQATYNILVAARCALQTGACGVFVTAAIYASIVGVTLTGAAPVVLALTCTALAFAVLSFLYKRGTGNKELIVDVKYQPGIKNLQFDPKKLFHKLADNFAFQALQIADDIAGSPNGMEKAFKFYTPLLEWVNKGVAAVGFARFEGLDNLITEQSLFVKSIGGLNFLDRISEWCDRDEEGNLKFLQWPKEKICSRAFLTGGHFVDFIKWLEWLGLISYGVFATAVELGPCTFTILMIKEPLIIGSAIYSYQNATHEVNENAKLIATASTKASKWKGKFNESIQHDATKATPYSFDYQSFNEKLTVKPLTADGKIKRDAKNRELIAPFSPEDIQKLHDERPHSLRAKKRELVSHLMHHKDLGDHERILNTRLERLADSIKQDKETLASLKKGLLTWPFRWGEVRALNAKIKDDVTLQKVCNWYKTRLASDDVLKEGVHYSTQVKIDIARYISQPGVVIKLPAEFSAPGVVPPVTKDYLTVEKPLPLPAGTQITVLINGIKEEIVLTSPLTVNLAAGRKPVPLKAGKELVTTKDIQFVLAGPHEELVTDRTPLILEAGVKIKLAYTPTDSTTGQPKPVILKPDSSVIVPAGSELLLSSGFTITLPVDVTIALPPSTTKNPIEEIPLVVGTPVEIRTPAALRMPTGGSIENTYILKSLSKTYRWVKIEMVNINLCPKIKFRAIITKVYEVGKSGLCILGFALAASATTVAAPWISLALAISVAPVGFFGVWKFIYDKRLDTLKKDDPRYKSVSKSVY